MKLLLRLLVIWFSSWHNCLCFSVNTFLQPVLYIPLYLPKVQTICSVIISYLLSFYDAKSDFRLEGIQVTHILHICLK